MIALLTGTIAALHNETTIIDVNGVGYLVHIPLQLRNSLVLEEKRILHITTVVREDAITLFGFETTGQRETFEILRSVNKIGPKLAMTILGHLPLDQLSSAIQRTDTITLSKIPGIGKKTAERMCLELKNKLPTFLGTPSMPAPQATRPKPDPLRLALAQLDYRKTEIDQAISSPSVPAENDADISSRLRAALRVLAKQSQL